MRRIRGTGLFTSWLAIWFGSGRMPLWGSRCTRIFRMKCGMPVKRLIAAGFNGHLPS